jgi:hypothetical protein
MSENNYTPSTNRVRQVWLQFAEMRGSKLYPDEVLAQFDRWLARELEHADDYETLFLGGTDD